jgi:Protein of unknown function (DUF3494).
MRLKNVFAIVVMLLIAFSTSCKKEEDPIIITGDSPTVSSSDPANSATGVALNRSVAVVFSEPMDQATITSLTFTLNQGSTPIAGTITYSGSTATFTPSANMEASKVYSGTITTGAKNVDGTAMEANHTFSFTTGTASDNVLPLVSSNDPASNATGVARNKVVSIVFSKNMNASTINSTTFTLKQGNASVAGTVSVSGTTASFAATSLLAASTTYTAAITTGAKDLAGNALATGTTWSFTTGTASAAIGAVNLGTAGNFVILAKTKVSTTGTTHVTGDIGISPAAASYITGFALNLVAASAFSTSALVTGSIYAPGYAAPTPTNLTTAVLNMQTAYTDAAGRSLPDFTELYTGNIGGKTLTPGLYKWTTAVTVPSSVTISGGADDVWIFQISGNLVASGAVQVMLAGGAQSKNIFWQVAGQATIGTTAQFKGIILCKTAITFQTGASLNGRALAQTAVVLDANAIVKPD